MKNYKLNIFYIFLFTSLFSQDSKGGVPYSIKNNIIINNSEIIMPVLDIFALINEDNNRPPATPFRYGYKFDVDYSLNNSGNWLTLHNGDKIWQLSIYSEGAFAISLEYNQFYLPIGANLYVFSQDESIIYGAYTNENNQDDMLFATPLIRGEMIYLEYYEPSDVSGQGIINIDFIIHDYKDILNFSETRTTRSCGDNVVCSSADEYQNQVNATSWLDMGGYICTGSMINNTEFDLMPYYWTAWHCVYGENSSTFRFYFNYETNTCSGSWANEGSYEYGGNLLSSSGDMDPDYALILITDNSISDGIFYAGWDSSSNNPNIACGVHHPEGEPKKINFDNDTAYSSGPISWYGGGYSPAGSHWNIIWDEGGTEGGSSGAPAYNNEGQLIGQLSGGSGNCETGVSDDYYGKFSRAFSDVSSWLDPSNSGAQAIDGTYDGISDSDGDGVPDNQDSDENNPYQCSDIDQDTCDDCSSGSYALSNDGLDYDSDGLCDAGDTDDDNDGITDDNDIDDNNEFVCLNDDGDLCDDCSSGIYDPENDGCIYSSGDINIDGSINIMDVVTLIAFILGTYENPTNEQLALADLNNDNNVNVTDVVVLISLILN